MPEATDNLTAALAKARAAFSPILKNREVNAGQMRYKYADLDTVLEAVTPALCSNGLTVSQPFRPEGEYLYIVTELSHTSGEKRESVYPIKLGQNHQQNGAAISYARRYSICAILGVVAEDDTDGHAARDKQARAPKVDKPTPEQEADTWIERQKEIIKGFPTRVMITEWRTQARTKKSLENLQNDFASKHEAFMQWVDHRYTEMMP